MKKYFSLIAPLIVNGLFATAPFTFAQATISIDYPAMGQTFTAATIPGVWGTAGPLVSGVVVTVEEFGGSNPENYSATGTTSWFVDEPIQLPVSPGVASIVGISAYGQDISGNPATAYVLVYYAPPPPTVSVGSPTNGQTSTTSPVTVSGAAASHEIPYTGIDLVQVQANGTNGTWQTASLQTSNGLTTSWSASVTLSPGTNTIYGFSRDGDGACSTDAWVNVTYDPPLTSPKLGIVKQSSNLVFTWLTNESGFVLQSSSNLGPAAVWSTNIPSPVVVGGQNVVTNSLSGSRMFYRLYLK
jgi:hypothetical protein